MIRTLNAEDVHTLVSWAADEGWNPGIHDAEAFLAVGEENFIGMFRDGQMLSAISAVAYGDTFGFIGLYIARPDIRGQGFGLAVFDAGMERLKGRTIGLDGVPEQQANYRKSGFVPDYGSLRYSGRVAPSTGISPHVAPYTAQHFEQVERIDRAHFPERRPEFLQRWLELASHASVYEEEGKVTGFGSARIALDGFKIGPIFAADLSIATAIFDALATACEGANVHIDVPDHQASFIAHLERADLTPGFNTARMYHGATPSINLAGVFAVTTLELG